MSSKDPDNRPTHGWSQAENLRKAEEGLKGELPKPFTVPDGYVPPTMMEQWRYAQRRHPYQKYGYGLVFLVGLSVYAAYTVTKVESFPVEHLKQLQVENTHKASKKAA